MAVVNFFVAAPAGFRMRDAFTTNHSAFTYGTFIGMDRASFTIGGQSAFYLGPLGGHQTGNEFQASFFRYGSGTNEIFQWDAVASGPIINTVNLVAFHESGDAAASRMMEGHDAVNGSTDVDYLEGYAGNDTLIGAGGADTMAGGDGNDSYVVSDALTILLEAVGGGFDMVTTSASFTLPAGQEIELLLPANPDTTTQFNLAGNEFGNTIIGRAGPNTLGGGGGDDYLFSRDFNPDGTIKAGAGNDILNGDAGNDGLFAGDGADTLNGGDGNDGLVGGGGTDTLNGGIGSDFLFGGGFSASGQRLANSGADTLNGGAGNDGLYGFDGADIINGDGENDYVEGGAGNDIINGGAGSDYLLGDGDNDTINGGTGFDYMYGGAGGDTFTFRKSDSADWILDFKASEGDKLRLLDFGYANFAAIPLVDLSTPGNPAVQFTFSTAAGTDQLTVFGVTLAQLNATNVLVA